MSSTTGGNPVSAAAALAVLDIMEEEKLVANSLKVGTYIRSRLEKLKHETEIIGDVRGKGLVIGIELVKDKTTQEPDAEFTQKLVHECCRNGLMVGRVGYYGNVIRVAPPLVITEDEAEESCDLFEKSVCNIM